MMKRFVSLVLVSILLLTNIPVVAEGDNTSLLEGIEVTPMPEATEEPAAEETAEVTAEPAAEEPAAEETAEPVIEETAEVTAEPEVEETAEVTAEPAIEETAEVTAEPEVEETAEPAAEVTAVPGEAMSEESAGSTAEPSMLPENSAAILTLDGLQPDQSLVSVGEEIRWTFACEGSEQVTYAIVNHRQETVAGGELGESREIVYTPAESGTYTLCVMAIKGEEALTSESIAYAGAGQLEAALETEQQYAAAEYADMNYRAGVTGGVAPYTVTLTVKLYDSVVHEETHTLTSADTVEMSYSPADFGKHEICMTVKDAVGTESMAMATMPVSVIECEAQSQWKESVSAFTLTGDWREDLIGVAGTQLGYEESERSFIIDENGEKRGYTRYGDWADDPYAPWSALFVSFSLHYANIPEEWVPQRAEGEAWKHALQSMDAYRESRNGYTPEPGDIIFFDLQENGSRDGQLDHVGIVEAVSGNTVKTIEGDADNAVRRRSYNLSDGGIAGYGSMRAMMERAGMLEKPEEAAEQTTEQAAEVTAEPTIEPAAEAETPEAAYAVYSEAVGTEEVLAAADGTATVLGVWYDLCIEKQPVNIYITTDLSAQYVEMYMGETKLADWSASEATITENEYNKEWLVTYTFEEPGAYYLWYKASADGSSFGTPCVPDPADIKRPALIGVWYDQTIEGQPTYIHVTTNLEMEHLELYLGEMLLDSWSASDEDVTITEYATCREWQVTYTFEEPGAYNLWYKASKDGKTEEIPYSPAEPLNIERPAVIGVWYADTVENLSTVLCVTTNLDMQYLYLYLGDEVLDSWHIGDEDVTITEYATCKEWTVHHTFTEPGDYYLWYKASEDGMNMERAFSETEPVTIKRPAIIQTWYETAAAGEALPMHITTNLDMNYLELYEGETLLESWSSADEGISIEKYNTCLEWHVSHVFENAGEHYLWYKATSDGVTEEIPYGDVVPVVIGEAGTLTMGDFQYKVNEDDTGAVIIRYTGSDAEVEIPATIGELPVVEIAAAAFKRNTTLNRVIVPEGVATIGSQAFANSTLSELVLPTSLTFIAEDAFEGCGEISVTAQEGCYAYDWAVEHGSINTSGDPDDFLMDCNIIEKRIYITDENSFDYIYNRGIGSVFIYFKHQYECTAELVKISGDAFDISYEGSWVLEEERGDDYDEYADYWCYRYSFKAENIVSLGEVHYQFNVTCNNVTKTVDIFAANAAPGDTEAVNVSEDCFKTEVLDDGTVSVIEYTGSRKSIIIPSEIGGLPVSKIGASAFEGKQMIKVVIPEGVTAIDDNAFRWNWELESAPLPSTIKTIGDHAFEMCGLQEITLPEGILSIGECAFGETYSAKSVHIPASVISIGNGAFYGCDSMETITLDAGNTAYKIIDDVLFSMDVELLLAWLPTKNATEYDVPDGVVEIADYAFFWVDELKTITFPDGLETIGCYAFCGCSELENFVIPNGCTRIGESAFIYCDSLTKVVLPDGLTRIDDGAFMSCENLTEVVLPDGIEQIGEYAFAYSTALTAINLPSTITYIAENAFKDCLNLVVSAAEGSYAYDWAKEHGYTEPEHVSEDCFETEVLDDGTVSIIEYTGSGKNIIIPSEIGGLPVSKIGASAFEHQDMIKVVIPEGVTAIGDYAFSWNWDLVSAPLPSTIKTLGDYAFNQCNLQEIELPEGTLSIGMGAFGGNDSVVSVRIPASVTSIGGGVFYGCDSMETITLDEDNTAYKIIDDVLFSMDGEILLAWLPTKNDLVYDVPDGVIEIADYAFNWAGNLKRVTFPDSLEIIEDCAFRNCSELENFVIPKGCTRIDGNAFEGCASLTKVVLPDGLTMIDWAAFAECTNLVEVVLPYGVEWIDGIAFADNTALTAINLPSTITHIEGSAFDNCPNLVASVVEGSYAYEWCIANDMKHTCVSEVIPETCFETKYLEDGTLSITGYVGEDTVVVVPSVIDGTIVTDIAAHAFDGCTEITHVVIQDGIETIGQFAFNDCSSLNRIRLPGSLYSIGDLAFQNCDLRYVIIPEYTEILGWNVFNNNLSLTKVVIPETVSEVGNSSIFWNEDGTGITVNGDIGGYTFYHWTEIKEIVVQNGCTIIGEGAFMDCTSLECVSLPESVAEMKSRVFAGCENLTEVNVPNGVTELGDFVFHRCAFSTIKLPDSLKRIGENAFQGCLNLSELEVPYGTEAIANRAFAACRQLTRVIIPETVTEIDGNIFESGNENVVIAAPQGSYAIEYAVAHQIAYEIIDAVP